MDIAFGLASVCVSLLTLWTVTLPGGGFGVGILVPLASAVAINYRAMRRDKADRWRWTAVLGFVLSILAGSLGIWMQVRIGLS